MHFCQPIGLASLNTLVAFLRHVGCQVNRVKQWFVADSSRKFKYAHSSGCLTTKLWRISKCASRVPIPIWIFLCGLECGHKIMNFNQYLNDEHKQKSDTKSAVSQIRVRQLLYSTGCGPCAVGRVRHHHRQYMVFPVWHFHLHFYTYLLLNWVCRRRCCGLADRSRLPRSTKLGRECMQHEHCSSKHRFIKHILSSSTC